MLNVSDDDVDVFYLFLHIELRAGNHWLYVAICTVGQDTRERARAREREIESEREEREREILFGTALHDVAKGSDKTPLSLFLSLDPLP